MIDLHCHMLPGVDDGPTVIEEAFALARAAVDNGIKVSVLTPHVHPTRYANKKSSLTQRFLRFQELVKQEGIPLQLRLAGEVRLSPESLSLFLEDEIPFLGVADGFNMVLLEFPHDTIPVGSLQFVDKLLRMKVRPLIAHPERNKMVMYDPEKIRPFVDMGCRLQLTAGSIAGKFGKESKKIALKLLNEELAWVIATDAHNLQSRPPDLVQGRDVVAEILGERIAKQMTVDRPARILGLDPVDFTPLTQIAA
jgi:protein-tyrosine phosphatase